MHEMGIAVSILERVRAEVRKHGGARPVEVGVRVGALSGVDREALRFAFDAIVKDTDLDPLALEIESVPHRRRCSRCHREYEAPDWGGPCPDCGEIRTRFLGGDELDVVYLEVEDPCPA